jgi:hypothetical protein
MLDYRHEDLEKKKRPFQFLGLDVPQSSGLTFVHKNRGHNVKFRVQVVVFIL